ncbi:MAG: DUF885 domain-containing protein [Chloroflexi bacterium]|nr:DUF885 domain-containing protein [Chloroflexota bacterium]
MTAVETFERLARDYFEESYRFMPVTATLLGIHQYDDRLGDLSPTTFHDYLASVKAALQQLDRLDDQQLPPPLRIDRVLVAAHARLTIQTYETLAEWRRNPNFYVELPLYGLLALVTRDFAPVDVRMRSLDGRLRAIGPVLQQAEANLENPPAGFTEVAIETAEGAVEFLNRAIPAFASQSPAQAPDVLATNGGAIAAMTNYLDFLKTDLLPRSGGTFAIGRAAFEEKLQIEHMLDLSADELRGVGRRAFDDTRLALERLARAVDPGRTWAELVDEARADHPAPEDLIPAYRDELVRLRAFIAERDLVTIPPSEVLEVVETPPFARATLPYAAYLPPAPFETSQKGQFWVTPIDTSQPAELQRIQLREHCYANIPAIALHEAYPGHHLQLVSSSSVSSSVRKHVASNLFAEGWALYCEQLMGEQGYVPAHFEGRDPRLFRLMLLKNQLWRAARILIDVGLHADHMPLDEAIHLLTDQVGLTERAARAEVWRYAMTPTQPMSYLVGKLEILRLRDDLKLPLKQFHDRLLSRGTIPLKLVRAELEPRQGGGLGVSPQ